MTYRELYEKAERKLEKGEITSGEFDEMTKPLDEEIRPHGEWIEHRQFSTVGYFYSEYECSNCHDEVWQKTEWQFCPNCGADMRKEGD